MDLIFLVVNDMQPGRLAESLIFLFVLFWRVKPHMKKIEVRMKGMEQGLKNLGLSMTKSFEAGEHQFIKLENQIENLDDRISNVEKITIP